MYRSELFFILILVMMMAIIIAFIFVFLYFKTKDKISINEEELLENEKTIKQLSQEKSSLESQKVALNLELESKNKEYVLLNNTYTKEREDFLRSNEIKKEVEKREAKLLADEKEFNRFVSEKNSQIHAEKNELSKLKEELRVKQEEFENNRDNELLKIAHLKREEAEEKVLESIRTKKRTEISRELERFEAKLRIKEKELAQNVLLNALENMPGQQISEQFSKVIKLNDDNIKGRLIGRDGRNIQLLENLLGVNVIIDDTPEQFFISSFNPIRRAKASRVFDILLSTGVINQASIEEVVSRVNEEFDESILERGRKALQTFEIEEMDIELVKKIGALYYRTSYGQNVYNHTLEVARISRNIANQLDLDEQVAVRCALLHDVGKIDSEEMGISHVDLGVTYARQAGEEEVIINAIEAHHGDVEPESIYATLLIVADKLSASQMGSRKATLESFIQRVEALEEIALSVQGVSKAYALKGGKELRIVVNAREVKDFQLKALAEEIRDKVMESMNLPSNVVVNVLRENRFITNLRSTDNEEIYE